MEVETPSNVKEALARRIAGEIVLSKMPGATMRKWREAFDVSQIRLSREMGVSPSVISDYESGRRRSPGTRFIRRFTLALLRIDEERGGRITREAAKIIRVPSDAILDIREFPAPVKVHQVCDAVSGELVACRHKAHHYIYGYTVIDSIKAIETLSGWDLLQIFGSTTERALIFAGVRYGRSPMVAVRCSMFKPGMVVMHGAPPDRLAVELAERDGVPLAHSRAATIDDLVASLRALYRKVSEEHPEGN